MERWSSATKTFEKGLSNAVKSNDKSYPPDWRLSYGARGAANELTELEQLREQLAAQQERLRELERKLGKRWRVALAHDTSPTSDCSPARKRVFLWIVLSGCISKDASES